MLKKILAAAAITAALVLGGSSAAMAQTYPAQVGCVANPATIVVGQTSVVTCTGLSPNATGTFPVTGPSGTVTTRTITTDAQGKATFSLVGPAAGNYTVSLVTSNGQSGSATVTVTAASAGAGGGSLPPTGTDVPAAAIWLGVGAIGIGGIAVAAAVARRRAASNR